MSPSAVLAEAQARGLTLTADGEQLRFRGPSGALTPALRANLQSVKPELLQLISRQDRRRTIADACAAAYGRLTAVGARWPTVGWETVRRVRPELWRLAEEAEERAEAAGAAAALPDSSIAPLETALEVWEVAIRAAADFLGRCCHDCGRPAVATLADPDTGERFCWRCAMPPPRTSAKPVSLRDGRDQRAIWSDGRRP